jgi:hypothetical protein
VQRSITRLTSASNAAESNDAEAGRRVSAASKCCIAWA